MNYRNLGVPHACSLPLFKEKPHVQKLWCGHIKLKIAPYNVVIPRHLAYNRVDARQRLEYLRQLVVDIWHLTFRLLHRALIE
ncbi:hypothetical protein PC116_g24380 [Phytophthora cactorum]|nr:hypothetical protein PC116_g24380 [Phytophthora cactorum]